MLHSKRLAALVPFSINQDKFQFFWKNHFHYNEFASGSRDHSVVSKSMVTNHFHPKIFDFVVKLVPQHLKCVNPMDFQSLIESKQKTIACDVKFQTVFGL